MSRVIIDCRVERLMQKVERYIIVIVRQELLWKKKRTTYM